MHHWKVNGVYLLQKIFHQGVHLPELVFFHILQLKHEIDCILTNFPAILVSQASWKPYIAESFAAEYTLRFKYFNES